MSRRAAVRRAAPIVGTVLLAVAAIVAVVLALPNGARTATTAQPGSAAGGPTPLSATRGETMGAATTSASVTAPALAAVGPTSGPRSPTDPARSTPPSTPGNPAGPGETVISASDPAGAPPATPSVAGAATRASAVTGAAGAAGAAVNPSTTTSRPPTAAPIRPTTPPPPTATPPTTTPPPTTRSLVTTATPPAPDFGIPVTLGNATQLITVTARTSTATVGTLRAWQKSPAGTWRTVYGPVAANLGSEGIGPASEYHSRTPLGTFTLTEAFGRLANPGTALPYHVTGPNDWWVSDVNAPSYNTLQTCAQASCPFNTRLAEHLQSITPYYDYAVVMDVNRSPVVRGGGSAFFLHVTVGEPTAGCVAIDRSTLVQIMRWLTPSGHPRIATGIA